MGPAVAHAGFAYPEGLAWSPDSESLLLSEAASGLVHRIRDGIGAPELLADLGGGANNVATAGDGGCLVAQNGGIDMAPFMARRYPEMERLPPVRPVDPGIVHLSPSGEATYLAREGLAAPNDIAIAADGSILVTDPGNLFRERRRRPCLRRVSAAGEVEEVASGFDYCNGLAPGESELLVSDNGYVDWGGRDRSAAVYRLLPDGRREVVVSYEDREVDGLAVAASGRIYVARQDRARVEVLEGGELVKVLDAPGTMITNVCFGGPGRRWLFAADARNGTLLIWDEVGDRGCPDHEWDATLVASI